MSPKLPCPELELRHGPASWIPYRPAAKEVDTSIDILELRGKTHLSSLDDEGVTYKTGLGHQEVVNHLSAQPKSSADQLLRILFVNGRLLKPLGLADFEDIRSSISGETADYLQDRLGVSPLFLATVLRKSWVLKSGHCHWVKDGDKNVGAKVVEGWYRYSCGLRSFPSYVWYSYESKCTTYIVTNCEYNGIQNAIMRCVGEGMGNLLLRPLAADGFIAEASSEGWGEEILRPRKTLIHYEHVDDQGADTRESVEELHVLSYNLLIIKEDLTDHAERLEYLLDVHKTLERTFEAAQMTEGVSLKHSLSFLLSETRIRKRWVDCYSNRTGIQINLWYNLSSQKDNKTNLKIADFTSKIATETQKDSSSMITMAAVTMAFLPGTFVSALFSMVFFETSTLPDGRTSLSVGASWWLFPAVTIPLTIAVFAIWHIWRTRRNIRQMNELRRMEEPYDTPDDSATSSSPPHSLQHSFFSPGSLGSLGGFEKGPFIPLSQPIFTTEEYSTARNMAGATASKPLIHTNTPQDSPRDRSLAVVQPVMTAEELHKFQKRERTQDDVLVPVVPLSTTTEPSRIGLDGLDRVECDQKLLIPMPQSSAASEEPETKATTSAAVPMEQKRQPGLPGAAPFIPPLEPPRASASAIEQHTEGRIATKPVEPAAGNPLTPLPPTTTSKHLTLALPLGTMSSRSYPYPGPPPPRPYPTPSSLTAWSRSPAHTLDQYSMAKGQPGGLSPFSPAFTPSQSRTWSDPSGYSPAARQCYPTLDEYRPSVLRRPFADRQSPLTVDEFQRKHPIVGVVPPTEGPTDADPGCESIVAAAEGRSRARRASRVLAPMNPDMTLEEYRTRHRQTSGELS